MPVYVNIYEGGGYGEDNGLLECICSSLQNGVQMVLVTA